MILKLINVCGQATGCDRGTFLKADIYEEFVCFILWQKITAAIACVQKSDFKIKKYDFLF